MRRRGRWRALLALSIVALAVAGGATASGDESRGIDPNQGDSLVQVIVPNKAAAYELQRQAEDFGIEFNDHYLGKNANGTYTVTVFGSEGELAALAEAGYELGETIEGPDSWEAGFADMTSARTAELKSGEAALGEPPVIADDDELVILRADYFENYAGRFLSVEAKNRLGGTSGGNYSGPAVSVSWNTGGSTLDRPGPAADEHQHRPGHDARHVHRAPDPHPHRRPGLRRGRADEDPHRLEHRRVARGQRLRVGRRRPAAARGRLPVRLHDAVHGPDRGLPAVRRAGGGVLEHRRDGPAAEPDQRVPAQVAGQHGRLAHGRDADRDRKHASRLADRRDRRPHVPRLGPRGRRPDHGRVPEPGRGRTRR